MWRAAWFGGARAGALRGFTLAPIVLAGCLGAAEARATVVTGTISGVIDHGTDYAGVFGPANAVLDGLRYQETFTYDTSKGDRGTFPTGDQISAYGNQPPVLTYSLTINGVTDTLDLVSVTFVDAVPGHDFRLGGEDLRGGSLISVFDIVFGSAFANLDSPKSFADTANGPDPTTPGFAYKQIVTFGRFDLQYHVVFDTERVQFLGDVGESGAPEPASWAMMLAGFLAVGGIMRRKAGGKSGRFGRRSPSPLRKEGASAA